MSNGNVPVMVPPQFARFMAEFFGDKRAVLWPVANILARQFPLDVAEADKEIELEGDFLYADSDSTGVMYIKLNNPAMPWIPVRTNFGVEGFPIRRIFVKWTAQAGKQINLLYGYGARVIPPNQDITSIGSITNPITLETWRGKNRLASPGFMRSESYGGAAGNYPGIQLENPAASGIDVLLDAYWIGRGSAAAVSELRFGVAALPLSGNGYNKETGGTAAVAQTRFGGTAAPGGTVLWSGIGVASTPAFVQLEEPIVLKPNSTVTLLNVVLAQSATGGFEWREIPTI